MPCKHKVGRITFKEIIPNGDTEFICCKCGKRIELTSTSGLIRRLLFAVEPAAFIWFYYTSAFIMYSKRSFVFDYLLPFAIMLILEWCIMVVYMKFFARFKEVSEERKPINISLRDDPK